MKTKTNSMVASLLLAFLTISCDQNDQETPSPSSIIDETLNSPIISNATSSVNLLFEELFEGTSPLSTLHKETAHSYSIQISDSVAYAGTKSARFELRDTDNHVAGGTRSEVVFDPATGKDRWYSFAVFFPAKDYKTDTYTEGLTQWHQWPDSHLGENWRSPTLTLQVNSNRLRLLVAYNEAQVCSGYQQAPKYYDFGEVPKDKWVNYTFHVVHSPFSDGLVQVWQNGNLILEHKGGNMYNDEKLPYWKLGIYKPEWNNSKTTDVSKRILFYDNIKVGNEKASLAEILSYPVSTPTEPVPTEPTPVAPTEPAPTEPDPSTSISNPEVISYTLVNADTDKDVLTFSGNKTISLSQLGLKNINIRANINASKVGSVLLKMWGSQGRTVKDNTVPYTYFWESNGNYQSWTVPAGSYTLRATPYSEADAKGTAGKSLTATLTVTR